MNWSPILILILLTTYSLAGEVALAETKTAGPLRVHPTNARYFMDGTKNANGSLTAVYLTGSHTWANLIDRGPGDPPPPFDFDGYLDFLEKHNHNFIRLWSRHISWYTNCGSEQLWAGPLAWQRTGPGKALDGKPKFDLTKFDPAYFERLRSRVKAAGKRGIHVSIMLFGGYQEAGPNWTGNPFHKDNNTNGIDGDPSNDGHGWETQTAAAIPKAVAEVQRAYVRKVIDTVNYLDNVLFEISNESPETSRDWQYEMIRFIHREEATKPKQHPVGMTAGYWTPDETRRNVDASPAEWVSYQFEARPQAAQEFFDVNNPFLADGRKVSIQDSDHWWVVQIYGNATFGRDWVWKSFCRGHNPILMEHLPPQSFVADDHPLTPDDPGYIASRNAMGQTRHYAERMNLATMTPRDALSSTKYCLADPGNEYLAYQPRDGVFTVELADGIYTAEWSDPIRDQTMSAGNVNGGGDREFKPPFEGAAVLYLKSGP
ncbi:MAG: DUF6298 domain-containing protein [Pirellulales bacterium]